MNAKSRQIIILLLILLVTGIYANSIIAYVNIDAWNFNEINAIPIENIKSDKISLEQEQVSSFELYKGAINIFQNRYDNDLQNLITSSEDQTVYYGLAGGIAGMGMKLIGALDDEGLFLSTSEKTSLINLVSSLGVQLNSSSIQNATDVVWPISNSSSYVDLGWDFGLAGIGAFYVELYNLTENNEFLTVASKIYDSIHARVNWTNGVSFATNIHVELYNTLDETGWYPLSDHLFFGYNLPDVAFNGMSLGTAGIGKSALNFLEKSDASNILNATELLNGSIAWLENNLEVNGSRLSIEVANKYPDLVSTSWATGIAGIADLFVDVSDYYDNTTLLDTALSMYDWLAYNSSDLNNFYFTWELQGTMIEELVEYGIDYGLAGVGRFLLKLADLTGNTTIEGDFRSLINYLTFLALPDGDVEKYGERKVTASTRNIGSTSYAYGGGGIVDIIQEAADYLGDSRFNSSAVKGKLYLISQFEFEGDYVAVKSPTRTNSLDNNPSTGYLGSFDYLARLLPGKLKVEQVEIQFGKVRNNETTSKNLVLENNGESPIDVNLSQISTPFSIENQSLTLASREIALYPVMFSSTGETTYSDSITVTSGEDSFNVLITGQSFDDPSITILEGINDGQFISSSNAIYLRVQVTDTSDVDQVEFLVEDKSIPMIPVGSKQFELDWKPNLNNGTYEVVFQAIDILGNLGEQKLFIEIGIYSTPFAEKLFSTQTVLILAGLTVALIIAAIIITRRYMS